MNFEFCPCLNQVDATRIREVNDKYTGLKKNRTVYFCPRCGTVIEFDMEAKQ